jgi:TolA-binding protein
MTRLATTASKQRKLVIVAGVILLAATLAASLYLTKRNSYRLQASEALFKARTKLGAELKAISDSMKPAETKVKAGKDKTPAAAPSIEFVKFNLNEKLPTGVAALQKVTEDFPNTLAGFDAKIELGSLYFEHGVNSADLDQAHHWFESAASTAPSTQQTIAALYNLGYAEEALGRCADAVKTFDRALNSGSSPFKGELLRGKARCQETLGDKAAAIATYDAIVKQLPNTEHAKFAETKKATL